MSESRTQFGSRARQFRESRGHQRLILEILRKTFRSYQHPLYGFPAFFGPERMFAGFNFELVQTSSIPGNTFDYHCVIEVAIATGRVSVAGGGSGIDNPLARAYSHSQPYRIYPPGGFPPVVTFTSTSIFCELVTADTTQQITAWLALEKNVGDYAALIDLAFGGSPDLASSHIHHPDNPPGRYASWDWNHTYGSDADLEAALAAQLDGSVADVPVPGVVLPPTTGFQFQAVRAASTGGRGVNTFPGYGSIFRMDHYFPSIPSSALNRYKQNNTTGGARVNVNCDVLAASSSLYALTAPEHESLNCHAAGELTFGYNAVLVGDTCVVTPP